MIPSISPLTSAGSFLPQKFVTYGVDCFVRGGVAYLDGSQGIDYQTWHGHLDLAGLLTVTPDVGAPITRSFPGAIAASVAFDRGMALAIAVTYPGPSCQFTWFDTNINNYVTSIFDGANFNMLACHDDVRDISSSTSDVICSYQRGHSVFYRQQRERYLIENVGAVAAAGNLVACGMGTQWRFLWKTQP